MPHSSHLAYRTCLLWTLLLSLSWMSASNAFISQPTQSSRRRLDKNSLYLFFADAKTNGSAKNDNSNQVPFVIEKLSAMPGQYIFEEIAAMCIEVFFNDEPTTTYVTRVCLFLLLMWALVASHYGLTNTPTVLLSHTVHGSKCSFPTFEIYNNRTSFIEKRRES